jgi:U32 family peptidase
MPSAPGPRPRTPELLAPGGSFLSAYYAFEAGADGVYLGLREFSARKAAQNFSMDQLRRIRRLAADRGKRIYVTINTVVQEAELPRLSETLAWLDALAVDGVIVQDLGVCDMLMRRFPRLAVHASTQMAVHNESGLRMAEDLGIRRVILSRELPLDRIRTLREKHPGIELEVFIHGALCYSFSGVCLASWALTGRSGNRGDCAQICRSLFADDAECGEGHFFSCRDLFLGREVLKLAEIGIDALKIEGRMKSPEYVYNVTRLYREVLDRGVALPESEYGELVRKAETSFSREKTTGWLHSSSGSRLIGAGFPGHRGGSLGVLMQAGADWMSVRLSADISLHDGAGIFPTKGAPVLFSVSRITRAGREVRFAKAGDSVSIQVPPEGAAALASAGDGVEIRHLSSRFLDLPQPKEAGFPLYKVPVDMDVSLSDGALSVRAVGFPPFTQPVVLDAAKRRQPFVDILSALLRESGESLCTLGELSFSNGTGLADDGIFVPPSELKRVKNALYAFLDSAFQDSLSARADSVDLPREAAVQHPRLDAALLSALGDRQALSPSAGAGIPFVNGDPARIELETLALHAGFRFLPLPPVMMDDAAWLRELPRLISENPGTQYAIGLNNVSHLSIASALAGLPNAWFFVDFSLYVASSRTLAFLRARVPRLLFAYLWIEGGEGLGDLANTTVPLVRVSPDFRPPLFYSLGCFERHIVNDGKCSGDCPRDFTRALRQGRNRFRLVVRDCVTYLFADR